MISFGRAPCDEGVIRAAAETSGCAERARPWVLAATILGSSMAFIDGSVVTVALPAIQAFSNIQSSSLPPDFGFWGLRLCCMDARDGACDDYMGSIISSMVHERMKLRMRVRASKGSNQSSPRKSVPSAASAAAFVVSVFMA